MRRVESSGHCQSRRRSVNARRTLAIARPMSQLAAGATSLSGAGVAYNRHVPHRSLAGRLHAAASAAFSPT